MTYLHQFAGVFDGIVPNARLVEDSTGALYGSTQSGGKSSSGVIFRLAPPTTAGAAWSYSVLYRFDGGADGKTPGDIIAGPDGTLYGTTTTGGTDDLGVVFRLSPPASPGGAWHFSKLHDFKGGRDGANPAGGPGIDDQGNIFGATTAGGNGACAPHGCGVVFRLSPPTGGSARWPEAILYAFHGGSDGSAPNGELSYIAADNVFYGTTMTGGGGCGSSGCGTVFKLTPRSSGDGRWIETLVTGFSGAPDGATPMAGLHFDQSLGALFGTTTAGGANGAGTVFEVIP
jgi:uncharacterized repeat protein (TIGR03803 family)